MAGRVYERVVRIVVLSGFAALSVTSAVGQRRFVLREKPYLADRLPSAPLLASPPPASTGKHCVWRVSNVPVPFYLVGTIHTLRATDYPLAEVYQKALRDSRRFLFEYNPKEHDAYAKKFRAAGQYPEGRDLRREVRPETMALLMQNLRMFHLRSDEITRYRPWALAFRLWSNRGYAAARGTYSVDDYLAYQAQRMGKEVAGLESVDEHVAFWRDTLQLEGERLLVETIAKDTRLDTRSDQTRAAWKKGDIAALSERNASLRGADLRMAQRLLDQRNARWMTRIEAEMKTGKATSIVAGAGHFSGPNSVVDLLQKRGYRIEQL